MILTNSPLSKNGSDIALWIKHKDNNKQRKFILILKILIIYNITKRGGQWWFIYSHLIVGWLIYWSIYWSTPLLTHLIDSFWLTHLLTHLLSHLFIDPFMESFTYWESLTMYWSLFSSIVSWGGTSFETLSKRIQDHLSYSRMDSLRIPISFYHILIQATYLVQSIFLSYWLLERLWIDLWSAIRKGVHRANTIALIQSSVLQ